MIRKHSIQYILLALLAGNLAFTSCSDSMVKEKLFSQIGDGNLSDIEGARLLTNGIYGYVQYFSYFGGNNWLMNVSSYSDEFFCNWGGTPETGWGGAQNFLNMDAGHAMSETNWNSVYSLITQCNEVITKYGESTEPEIIQYVAEARFWRAFSYDKYIIYSVRFLWLQVAKISKTALPGLPKRKWNLLSRRNWLM